MVLLRHSAADMVWIVKKTRIDLVDDAVGWGGFRRDVSGQLDRVCVTDQALQIDDVVGGRNDLDRGYARIDSRLDQRLGDFFRNGLIRRSARLLRSLGQCRWHERNKDKPKDTSF